LLSQLKPGPVKVTLQGGEEQLFYVSGGFVEVQPSTVSILADTAVRAADLDEAAVLEAQKAAEAALHNQQGEMDYGRAAAMLAEAAAQLRTVQAMRKRMGRG
jgi:F-type H+-transporting ATPase subunit epsilon